jgi:hypothetical protein
MDNKAWSLCDKLDESPAAIDHPVWVQLRHLLSLTGPQPRHNVRLQGPQSEDTGWLEALNRNRYRSLSFSRRWDKILYFGIKKITD